jgi:hypothetical protein
MWHTPDLLPRERSLSLQAKSIVDTRCSHASIHHCTHTSSLAVSLGVCETVPYVPDEIDHVADALCERNGFARTRLYCYHRTSHSRWTELTHAAATDGSAGDWRGRFLVPEPPASTTRQAARERRVGLGRVGRTK